MHNGSAPASSAVLVSYAAWRTEAERIARLARSIPHDKRLCAAVAAVMNESSTATSIGADGRPSKPPELLSMSATAATAAAPSFLQRMLYSTPTSSTESLATSPAASIPGAQRACLSRDDEAASLLQLLALAEMPSTRGTAALASSSSADKRRSFAEVLEAVSASIASSHDDKGSESGPGDNVAAPSPSLISCSHAILPMRETVAAPHSAAAAPHTASRVSAGAGQSLLGGGDVEDDFDILCARLRHRAVVRSGNECTISPLSHSAPSPTTESSSSAPVGHAGLGAARAALDAADALLLRLRRQYRLNTAPNGRLAEAQTLLLRAAVCREAQLYAATIMNAVSRRLNAEKEQRGQRHVPGPCRRCPSSASSALLVSAKQDWAALTAAESREPLTSAIRKELACFTQSRQHPERCTSVAHDKGPGGYGTRGAVERTLSSVSASPQFTEALTRWRQVVAAQQRSLRMEEVQDYLAAAQLFLAAAAEEQQLGGGGGGDARQRDALCCESPLMLATQGVTQVLRACGLLLSDTPLEKEVPYPPNVVKEMAVAAAAEAVPTSDTVADKLERSRKNDELNCRPPSHPLALPPLLARGGPHATRVWMLLAQLATFLERTALQLPWDTKDIATRNITSTLPAEDGMSNGSSTTQLLWELSAAVLLHRPLDALQALQDVLLHASLSTTAPPKVQSLRDLFSKYTSPPIARPSSQPSSAAPSASNTWVTQVQAQPGTLPLCLLSLRRAIAAAVRAHHYAEALLDVEVGLHLLRGEVDRLDPVRGDGHEAEPNEAVSKEMSTSNIAVADAGGIDYRRLVYWPKAATTTPAQRLGSASEPTTKTVASAVTYLSDGVVLTMQRVLLLLVTSPMASGEAVERLQQRQCGNVLWWRPEAKGRHTSTSASHNSSPLSNQERSNNDPLECASDVVRCVAVSLMSALETLDTLTAHLQLLERHLMVPQSFIARSCAASSTARNATCSASSATRIPPPHTERRERFDPPASEEVRLLPSFPGREHRLEHVVSTSFKAAEADLPLSDAFTLPAHGTERVAPVTGSSNTELGAEVLTEHLPSPAAEGGTLLQGSSRAVCTLTSSMRYQRLKMAYRLRLSSQVEGTESLVTPAGPGGDASSEVVCSADDFHSDTARVDGVQPEAKAEAHISDKREEGIRFRTQSAALAELAQVVRELWMMVGVLTLPLRAASTCTTPPTVASAPLESAYPAAGEQWFEEGSTTASTASTPMREAWSVCESGISYSAARLALSSVEPRMERCLRVLGDRDRTVLALLRRLQAELLFPRVCRSIA
ncbi:hypothetical protein LSCM4_07626 [Leishmania orientalis]|uniref:Uncharacterized protein n=1 Tax=Leishmania orientalis TaxID=2249476 RepID=A0A836H4X4_9TRYP|nr:hypothetical protein LSCM4_07626 [Leishmania orientalis]